MADNPKIEPTENTNESDEETKLLSRRNFLVGLHKWSAIIIGGTLLAGALPSQEARAGWVNGTAGWINGRGGGWVNGTAGWVNKSGGGGTAGWVNKSGGGGSAGWINKAGNWVNGRAWVNR